jgi:phosphoribosylformylglycinamidine synthase subunit PurS
LPKVIATITLKPGLLDTQGRTIEGALQGIGFDAVSGVRVGKVIEMQLAGSIENAREQAKSMCEKLLANPVMESYRIEVSAE